MLLTESQSNMGIQNTVFASPHVLPPTQFFALLTFLSLTPLALPLSVGTTFYEEDVPNLHPHSLIFYENSYYYP